MFEALSGRLAGIFERLRRRGTLSERDVEEALREVRIALLEADVALPVVRELIAKVRERAVGQAVIRSVSPAQQVVKIVHEALVEALGGGAEAEGKTGLDLAAPAPVPLLLVGLQGSGKTTTAGKIAFWLRSKERKKVLLASLDVYRPAAQLQLQTLAQQAEVGFLPIVEGEAPLAIAKRALETARRELYDVVLLDTAGRLAIDEGSMAEAAAIKRATDPKETLLVVDAMTGQDAVATARAFHEKVGVSGIVMTRIDGDARGGAALSMRAITGAPIKLLGVGEKLDALEAFHPARIASRILGMGDIVTLVEKAAAAIDREEAEKLAARLQKGHFTLDDYAKQLEQIGRMGNLSGLLGLLPGAGRLRQQLAAADLDVKLLKRQAAIISSMTREERRRPEIIKASRKRRIAAGSGTSVQEVNRLLKQFEEISAMMKRMNKLGEKGLLRAGLGALLPGVSPRRPF